MDNLDEQAHYSRLNETEQFYSDYLEPPWEYAMNTCPVPSYVKQPQNLLANTHFSPLPSPATAEGFAGSTRHLPHGGLHTPTTTGNVDFSVAPNLCQSQSQWSRRNSSSTLGTSSPSALVPQLHNQYQTPHGILCGWSSDFEPSPITHSIPSIPQPMPPTLTPSYSNVELNDAWMSYFLGGGTTCGASPDEDTALSTQNQYQIPHEPLCGWSRDYETLVVPPSIPSIPQSKRPTFTPSYSSMGPGQYDPWTSYALGGDVDTCSAPPNGDIALSASRGFHGGAFADYDSPSNACADPQPSIALTDNAMLPVQSTALLCSEPVGGTNRQTRNFERRWLANGAPNEVSVMADKRSPHGIPCGWFSDFEPSSVLPGIPNIPQSMPPMLTPSYSNMGQNDAWMLHVLGGGITTTSGASSDGDAAFSGSGFHGAFADYDVSSNARADPQPSIALTHNAMSSAQSTVLPCSEPVGGTNPQARNFECRWLANGAPCGESVVADRRSIIEHLQHDHGITTGDEKARKTCRWEGCRTTLNKESLPRHILAVHLKEGVHCTECGLLFAREDSLKRHLRGGQHKVPSGKGARQPPRNHAGFQ